MDSPPTGMIDAGPPDLRPPRRRRSRAWAAVAITLLVVVLIAALIAYVRSRGPEASTPGRAAPAITAAPTGSAPVLAGGQSTTPTPLAKKDIWRPEAGLSWQWQLQVPVDQSVDAAVYDIDGLENDASVVSRETTQV